MGIADTAHLGAHLRQLAIIEPCSLLEEEGKGHVKSIGTEK
jgi:hypothetical protein